MILEEKYYLGFPSESVIVLSFIGFGGSNRGKIFVALCSACFNLVLWQEKHKRTFSDLCQDELSLYYKI